MRKVYIFVCIAIVLAGATFVYKETQKSHNIKSILTRTKIQPIPTPTPFKFTMYRAPKIENKKVYKIAMIGDSMTAALGPHGGGFSEYINTLYKKNPTDPQRIIVDNYAGSSNILAVNDQLSKKKTISEYTFGPLLSEDYDLILVESYGYNPLSQYGIENGIKKQNEALDMFGNSKFNLWGKLFADIEKNFDLGCQMVIPKT